MFKVGDKVVCVDAEASGESLVLGKTYVLADVQEEYVVLEGCEESYYCYYWMNSRFKLESEIMDNTTPTELDPLVEIRQSEYTALIEEVNLLQELLAEANARNQSIPEPTVLKLGEFKPVSEYTMEDWEQALKEKWAFEQRDGSVINIIGLDYLKDTSYQVETESSWLRLNGAEYDFGSSDSDIIKRIK